MIDNVKLFLPRCRGLPDIGGYLEDGSERTSVTTGEVSTHGSIGNVKVSQYFGGYYIQGSLPKFLHGDNVCQLTRKEVGEAVDSLADRLHLPLRDADVKSIEVGANVCLSKPCAAYTSLLGDMPRLQRVLMGGSLYYRGRGRVHLREFYFYDKVEEVKAKGGTMPRGLEAANMLRYEMRLSGRLTKQLGIAELKASTLQDRAMYRELISRWLDGYLCINKITDMEDENIKSVTSVKEAKDLFLAQLIVRCGGSNAIDEYLSKVKAAGNLKDRREINKLRGGLQRLASKSKLDADNGNIEELTGRIKAIAQNS